MSTINHARTLKDARHASKITLIRNYKTKKNDMQRFVVLNGVRKSGDTKT